MKGDFKRKQVRALKSIKKGEEILVNYSEQGPHINYGSKSREVRREELLEKRGFMCRCSECSLKGKDLEDNERIRREIAGKRIKIGQLMGSLAYCRAMEESEKLLNLVKKLDIRLQFLKDFLGAFMVASVVEKMIMPGPDPEMLQNAAYGYAIGDAYMHHYSETIEEFKLKLNKGFPW